ncbi:MAG: hypothetical protein JJU06_15250 [Ectothiorhodospiraceae bacterium]|nr:hypothetical protein [Ectothiorhodospiraceae bacterium]
MMLELLGRIAATLQPAKRGLLMALPVFAVLSLLAALGVLPDGMLILSVMLMLWTLLLVILINGFRRIPPQPGPGMPLLRRLSLRLRRAGYWLLGVATLGFTVAVLAVTLRVLVIWLG